MPPKGKKGVYTIPADSKQADRRREQERKRQAKKLKRSLNRLKKEEKQNEKLFSSVNSNADNPDTFQYETSGEETEIRDDINLHNSSFDKPSTSRPVAQQVIQQNNSKDVVRKKGKNRKFQKEKSTTKPKPLASSKIVEIGQGVTQSNQLLYTDYKILPNNALAKGKFKAENKDITEKKVLELVNNSDSTTNNSKSIPLEAHSKLTEDFINKENTMQKKLAENETDIKSLEEQEAFRLSPVEEKDVVVSGDIQVLASDKSVEKIGFTYSFYNHDTNTIHIGDENVRISILVKKGCQVVCNSKRTVTDLVQNSEKLSCPLEIQTAARSDEENKKELEEYDHTNRDKNCDLSRINICSRNCQTVDNQPSDIPDTDNVKDSEPKNKTATDTKCKLGSSDQPSEESYSSVQSSVQEKLPKVCEEYLKNLYTTCKEFETKVENHMEGN